MGHKTENTQLSLEMEPRPAPDLGTGVKTALVYFGVQLGLNTLWSVAFFGLKSPLAGAIVIVLLLVAILLTMLRFFRLSRAAGWLLVPYIVWVCFASALNISILVLNP